MVSTFLKDMKFLIIILFVGTNVIFGQANWQIVRNPWKGDFKDVYFRPGTQMGWAIGASFYDTSGTYLGNIAHTTNGGQTWTTQMGSTNMYHLKAICFTDENCGWLVGNSGLIKHTIDGGQTWVNQSSPVSVNLTSLSFIDNLKGWVFGLYGYILHTNDAGNTWVVQYQLPDELWIEDGIFKDSLIGWIAGYSFTEGGRIYKTTDGGNTWILLNPGTNYNFYGIDFYDLNLGWAVTATPLGAVTRTTDGGTTWSAQVVSGSSLLGVKFIDFLSGWAVGGAGSIYHSTDGGLTWNLQYNPIYNDLWSVFPSDENNVWAVGDYGTILHSSNAGNTWEYQVGGSSNYLWGIDASDTLNIWAVGDWQKTVLHSSDGGFTWFHQDVGEAGYGYLRGVSFSDNLHGATGGYGGLLYTTSDGGETWILRDPGAGVWYGVAFIDSLRCWIACEEGGKIKSTQDGGNIWTTQYQQYGQHFEDIMFVDDTLGWACGFIDYHNSFIVRTTDGGQFWDCDTLPIAQGYLWSIDFVSPYFGFVVGDHGEIYKSVNGGISWDSLHNDTLGTSPLYKVDFVDSLNGWVVSSNTIYRTRDGGNTWQTDKRLPGYPSGSNTKGLTAFDTLHTWLCMEHGKILRYGMLETGIEERDFTESVKSNKISLKISPNPFREKASIVLSAEGIEQRAELKIYDITGRVVKNFNLTTPYALRHTLSWDGTDQAGHQVPAGVYFVQLNTVDQKTTRKVILLK